MSSRPSRGEVWLTDFGAPVGHEVGYRRPAVVIGSDRLNRIGAVVVVMPLTTRERRLPTHVAIPSGGRTGLSEQSWAKVDDVKSVSPERLQEQLGEIDPPALARIEEALRLILEL